MIRFVFLVAVFLLESLFVGVHSQDYMQEVWNIGLPVLNVSTVNSEEPTCDYVTHPEGAMGEGITNATKVPAKMCIVQGGDTLYYSGEYAKDKSGLTIKIRGNTSAYLPKKPYKLKLQKKNDLLLRNNNDVYKDKNWLLMPISIHTITGLKVNELIEMPYTPQYRFVNVCINDDYRGVYMLMESVDRNENCRIDVAKEEGFVVELDPYWWNEDLSFTTMEHDGVRYRYTFKYPDSDEVDDIKLSYIQSEINAMEASFADGTYNEVIDVESFAKWLLGQDILGVWDSGGSNKFFAKYDESASSKIFIPCMWDFDSMARMNDDWARIHNEDIYYNVLFQSKNTTFMNAYIDLWEIFSDTLYCQIEKYFSDAMQTDEWASVEASLLIDQQRWDYVDCTLAEDAEDVCSWLTNRKPWLSGAIGNLKTGLNEISEDYVQEDMVVYSVEGVRICQYRGGSLKLYNLPKGIYIINRRKFLVK